MTTLAIFGASCTGKTSVAKELLTQLNYAGRHCGDEVRALAKQRGLSIPELTLDDHRKLDLETALWVTSTTNGITDGCYLDYVLADLSDVVFVRLDCEASERERRLSNRSGKLMLIVERDRDDAALIRDLYPHPAHPPDYVIDTTSLTILQTSDRVLELLALRGDLDIWGRPS